MRKYFSAVALTLIFMNPFCTSVSAEETGGIARVLLASPTTTFEGRKVIENDVLKTVGSLRTGKEGGAKLKLVANEVLIEISANSEIKLVLSQAGDASESIELIRGRARLRVPPLKKKLGAVVGEISDKPHFLLRHRKVTMGVRGTYFLAIANEGLGETELVVFSGTVEFTSAGQPTTAVKPGHWIGIGGRFGEKTHGPVHLSPEGLRTFETGNDLPGYTVEKTPEVSQSASPAH